MSNGGFIMRLFLARGRSLTTMTVVLLLVVLCVACSRPPLGGSIEDLQTIPQDVSRIMAQNPVSANDQDPLPDQNLLAQHYLTRFFAPWHVNGTTLYPSENLLESISTLSSRQIVGENLLPWTKQRRDRIKHACHVDSFPNRDERAITITDSHVRALPTHHPGFYPFDRPGEGYPFDSMQYSILWAGTPVHICHLSRNRDWALVEAGFVFGWVAVKDLALVDDAFVARFQSDHFAVPLRDGLPVIDTENIFRCMTHVGAIYPVAMDSPTRPMLLLPAANASRQAVLVKAPMEGLELAPFPLPMTRDNGIFLAQGFMGQPYGWGGMYANRDCSAMTRDFMTPFGIWLNRNSSQQAKQGKRILLAGLSAKDKEAIIKEKGIPLRTLIWMPGHIALYLGQYQGRPVIMHNTWGLKTKTPFSGEGRYIIGRTVITTLYPGAELPHLDRPSGLLINKITGMSTFP